jgi:membrane protein implicated in regulation of membrane protease activity
VLIVVAIVLLLVLSSPWNLIAFIVLVPLWILELVGWNRTVKNRRNVVGVQTLVGRDALVTSPCLPDGQVRVGGETWQARCDAGASPGDRVRVSAVDGLTLVVEPAA